MAKQPAFQFYPADWLNDVKLQACSMAAQGLLINMMCLMHQSEKYGYCLINGDKPSIKQLKNLLRVHHKTFIKLIKELLKNGVIKEINGVYYCKRMVQDEAFRQMRRKCGTLGGNPNFKKGKPNPYYFDNQKDNQKITPSSSSSSSSSLQPKLREIKNYPFDEKEDSLLLQNIREHYPSLNLSATLEDFRLYCQQPKKPIKNYRLTLRNFCRIAASNRSQGTKEELEEWINETS